MKLLTTKGMCGPRGAPMVPYALHWYTYHCKVLFNIDNHRDSMLFARARIIECRWYIFPSIKCRIKYRYLFVNITIDTIRYSPIITGHTQKPQGLNSMLTITRKDIMYTKLLTNKAKLWAYSNIEYLNTPMRILGTSTKVEKGSDKRDTYIVYMQPADKVALDTICAMAVAGGCKAPCLKSSGQLGIAEGNADRAATKRTIWYLMRYNYFVLQLKADIDKAERKALKTGIPALFRLNGTSDLDFSDIIAERPQSQFYDYTKILSRVRKNTLANYDLTFSASMYSVQSKAALKKAVQSRYKIAVAYNTKGLQSDNIQVPSDAVSFDTTDLRPLDSSGTIGILKRKGSNKVQRASEGYQSFFVTADNAAEFNNIIAIG